MKKSLLPIICFSFLTNCGTVKTTNLSLNEYSAKNSLKPYSKTAKKCYIETPFGFVSSDITVRSVAQTKNITEIVSVEKTKQYLIFVNRVCTIVNGN